ncbi:tRNA 2-thiouridine(34) synthase MnmA [Candidatus Hydrogenedentota bacterium]
MNVSGTRNVAVALSGGVDSSVAVAELLRQGHHVIAVTMRTWIDTDGRLPAAPDSVVAEARKVAKHFDVPHNVLDFEVSFRSDVVVPYIDTYLSGLTPNPCVRCNRIFKFGRVLDAALELGANFIATGHYVRISRSDKTGRYEMSKGADSTKDQSYVLCLLSQEQLARAMFPLGGLSKKEVRRVATEAGLDIPPHTESQDVCFLPDQDYRGFLGRQANDTTNPGPIVDKNGIVLGQHKGLPFYTIGQRKKLGIGGGKPYYVTALVPETNTIAVGSLDDLGSDECHVGEVNWVSIPRPKGAIRAEVKLRYQHAPAFATVTPTSSTTAEISFDAPQRAISPGQFAVFYNDDLLLGGGAIEVSR